MSTFVLIHGAGSTAWDWHLVSPYLRDRGNEVVAMDLPCDDSAAGLEAYVDCVLAAIGDRTDLVVGAHSLGGFTAPLVCARVPVQSLVLIAAMVPAPGETGLEWWDNSGYTEATRDEPDRDLRELFLHDSTRSWRPRRWRAHATRPVPRWPSRGRCPSGRMSRPATCSSATTACSPRPWARRHARERLGVVAEEMGGSHCAYLSRPAELAELSGRLAGERECFDDVAGDDPVDALLVRGVDARASVKARARAGGGERIEIAREHGGDDAGQDVAGPGGRQRARRAPADRDQAVGRRRGCRRP